ncbi:transglycosylase SLT domain-containing protein [Streptomyces sp. V4-01]|uniref:Transglycosylase SLT domain-containing protein n=1 Tax=Actinacidiphila polyblastidii TaxID=3110430 RepID=A0ABU7PPB4_9ACTN|nr:transglycosylase SLT domain-containing protein [Streptomyces sp. V4-01]
MQLPAIPKKLPTLAAFNRLPRKHKITTVGAGAGAAVVLAVTGLQATAGAGAATAADAPTGFSVTAGQPLKQPVSLTGATTDLATHKTVSVAPKHQPDLAAATKPAPKKAAPKATAKKTAAKKATAKKAAAEHTHKAASRSAKRTAVHHAAKPAAAPRHVAKTYGDNLDGWIRQSLDIMHAKGIPGSYEGIHRNIIRESSGNPQAINLWDINARNGIPSKGLLQMINPTFNRYHVSGTSWNIYNPVANITAACNYAADRYGTMDNVNSAY